MLEKLSETLGTQLAAKHLKVATAESCTGGMVAVALTAIPGSSDYFERGFVTYSNEAKHEMLGVPLALIDKHGAVSEEVAIAMAQGALEHSHADVTVSITGIAGPDGGTKAKPIGTVWFGLSSKAGLVKSHQSCFEGNRDQIRCSAAEYAVNLLIEITKRT